MSDSFITHMFLFYTEILQFMLKIPVCIKGTIQLTIIHVHFSVSFIFIVLVRSFVLM